METNKMTKREMFTFASGDLFGGGAQVVIAFWYLVFLTDVVGITPALAGTVILIAKIWDAVSDPMMGLISDNTRTKYGRRKPYLLAGFFLIIIAYTMLWYSPTFSSVTGRFVFVVFAYLFFSTVSTMVMVPYAAMSSEISLDTKERNVVNGSRLFFSQIASLLGAVLPPMIVKAFAENESTESMGYLVSGIAFAVFFALPYLAIFFTCKERVPMEAEKSKFSVDRFISPFKIKVFRNLIGMYLLAFLVMDVVSAIFAYYMRYYIGKPEALEMVLGTMLITQIVLLPVVVMLANRIGKAKTFIIGSVIFMFGAILLGSYSPSWPSYSIYVIAGIAGMGLIACIVIPWIMFPDVTDTSELAFGERRSGSFGGIMTFMRKFSSALGIWIVGLMLGVAGYVAPIKEEIDGKWKTIYFDQPGDQPESLILALKLIVFILPVVLLIIAIVIAKKYPLNKQTHDRLVKYINDKKNGNDIDENEVNELKEKLI